MKDLENLKFMSIGGNCADIAYLGKDRLRGPVDNVVGRKGLLTIRNLFEDNLLNVIKETPWKLEPRKPDFPGDSEITYLLTDYRVVHNDPRTEKYQVEIEKRFNNFKSFYEELKNNPKYYFTYSLNYFDVSDTGVLSKNFFEGVNLLKSLGILDKVIFIGTTSDKVAFWNFFPKEHNIPGLNYIEIEHFSMKEPEGIIHNQFLKKIEML